jgi:hypothetical protein
MRHVHEDYQVRKEKDPYASEEETKSLLVPDTRSSAEFQLDALLDAEGAWEQGADPYTVLYRIAIMLIEEER